MTVALENNYHEIYSDFDLGLLVFLNKTGDLLRKIPGYLGIVFIYIPLHYLFVAPLLVFLFNTRTRFLKKNYREYIEFFQKLDIEKRRAFLKGLKENNRQFEKSNEIMLNHFSNTAFLFKPIYLRAKKFNEISFDIENEWIAVMSRGKMSPHGTLTLSKDDSRIFVESCFSQRKPNEALIAAFNEYRMLKK